MDKLFRNMNQRRSLRYLLFIVVGGLLLWYREHMIREYLVNFELKRIQLVSFIILFILGAMLACLNKDVFKKESWRFEFKVDVLVYFLVFVIIGTMYIHTWRFVLDMMLKLNQSIGTILHLAQLLSGFMFLQFFLVSEEGN